MRWSYGSFVGFAVLAMAACSVPVSGSAAPAPVSPALAGLADADPCALLPAADYVTLASAVKATGARVCKFRVTGSADRQVILLTVEKGSGLDDRPRSGSPTAPTLVAGFRARMSTPPDVQVSCKLDVGVRPDLVMQVEAVGTTPSGEACASALRAAGLVLAR